MKRKQYLLIFVLSIALCAVANEKELEYGVVDLEGNMIIPFEYEDIIPLQHPSFLYPAKKNGKWGAIDTLGRVVIPFISAQRLRFAEGYVIFESDDKKMGAYDFYGNILIEPKYERLWSINKELIGASIGNYPNNINGVVSLNGEIVIPFEYSTILPYIIDEQYLIVEKKFYNERQREVKLSGVINLQNKLVVPFEYHNIWHNWSQNFTCQKYNVNNASLSSDIKNEAFILNSSFDRITQTYDDIETANDSMAVVEKDDNWGIIKLDGEDSILLPFEYMEIFYFTNDLKHGFAKDSTYKKSLLLNDKIMTDFIYDEIDYIHSPFKCFLVEYTIEDDNENILFEPIEVIDEYGNTILSPIPESWDLHRDKISAINRETFIVALNISEEKYRYGTALYGIINSQGDEVMPFEYQLIKPHLEYTYEVGHITIYISPLTENWILIKKDDICSIMDITTKEIMLTGYPEIIGVYNNQYIVGR